MKSEEFPFRKDILESLPPQNKRYDVKDAKSPGLRLLVYPAGSKTFILYKRVGCKQRRLKIGSFPDTTIEQARKAASEYRAIISAGKDPEAEKRALRYDLSFKELYEKYYTEHAAVFTKDPKANRRMMEFHIFPVIGNQKISLITRESIRKLHATMGENRGRGTANRVIGIVSAVFNHGIKNDYFKHTNPCDKLKKFPLKSRDRFLSINELTSFFDAIAFENGLFKDFFSLLLYTGARKSNVLCMKWADIDFSLKRWRISEEHTKNKDVNIVMLSEPALVILQTRLMDNKQRSMPSEFVFPGNGKNGHLKDPKKAFERVRQRMKVKDFRMHDLRRTLGSYMAINGASLPVIGKALNHKSQVSTAIYARLSEYAVSDAVDKAAVGIEKFSKRAIENRSL